METAGEDAGGGGGGLDPGEVTCQAIPHQHTPYMPLERGKTENVNHCIYIEGSV